jgi:hypothetical protein
MRRWALTALTAWTGFYTLGRVCDGSLLAYLSHSVIGRKRASDYVAMNVRTLTDAQLIAARKGGPLESYGAKREGLPPRSRDLARRSTKWALSWRRRLPPEDVAEDD